MTILDSGNRTEFNSGAVRDMKENCGRCDLMPLDIVGEFLDSEVIKNINNFQNTGFVQHLYNALDFINADYYKDDADMILDASIHYEEGAKKYGEYNWQKGIPVQSYIDSAVRHYLKHLRGDDDENHLRAFVWNILCLIWTVKHKEDLGVD